MSASHEQQLEPSPIVQEKAAYVTCNLCPHFCRLAEGEVGFCHARQNVAGKVIDQNYGRATSLALDPIEKKPLAQFMPGAKVLSYGSYGCNLRCPFCQNASISTATEKSVRWTYVSPEELVREAVRYKPQGNVGIAFTYNEPLVGFEFLRDTAQLAHEAGLVNVLVSNGMINPAPLQELLGLIDAANIDLKGFTQEFYDFVEGDLQTVKRTIESLAKDPTCHLEVTTLIIPRLNDNPETIAAAAQWLASLDADITYHVTRFHPCHKLQDRQPTPVKTVYDLADVARNYLEHVHVGNC